MDVLRARPAPERDHHPGEPRERDRRDRLSGGSTNGVLHLLAIAAEMGIELSIRRFRPDQRAHAAAVRPEARSASTSRPTSTRRAACRCVLQAPQGRRGCCNEGAITVTGETVGEIADATLSRREGQRVVRPLIDPLKPTGGLAILRGNLAPEGCVVKLAGHERRLHVRAGAACSSPRRTRWRPSPARTIEAGDVVVIRNEGPAGGPGMREMLAVTAAISRRGPRRGGGADHRRALLGRHARPDGRPRRAGGGPGRPDRRSCATATRSRSTSTARRLDVALSDDGDRGARTAATSPPSARSRESRCSKYAKLVSSAAQGAITR